MMQDNRFLFWSLHYSRAHKQTLHGRAKMEGAHEEEALFGFVIKGQIAAVVHNDQQGAVRKLLTGEVFYLAPYSRFTLHNPLDESVDLLLIHFHMNKDLSIEESHSPFSVLPGAEHSKLYKCPFPQMHHWLDDFMDTGKEEQADRYYRLHSLLYAIMSTLLKYNQHPQAKEGDLESYVRQIRQLIINNFDKDLDIEQTARLSGVSPNRFYQAFKQATGLSPHKFMTYTRLNASLSLLAANPASIMSVAHTTGYTDELYFSRLFKKHMGLTPSEYAQASQQAVAVLSPEFQGDLQVLGLKARLDLSNGQHKTKDDYKKQLVQLSPDLILSCPGHEVTSQPWASDHTIVELDNRDPDWKDRLSRISDKLGIAGVASRWLNHYENKAANVRKLTHKWFQEKPFLVVQAESSYFRLFGIKHYAVQQLFYGDFGLKASKDVQNLEYKDAHSLGELKELENCHVILLIPANASEHFHAEVESQCPVRGDQTEGQIRVMLEYTNPWLHDAYTYGSLLDSFLEQLISGKYGG